MSTKSTKATKGKAIAKLSSSTKKKILAGAAVLALSVISNIIERQAPKQPSNVWESIPTGSGKKKVKKLR